MTVHIMQTVVIMVDTSGIMVIPLYGGIHMLIPAEVDGYYHPAPALVATLAFKHLTLHYIHGKAIGIIV